MNPSIRGICRLPRDTSTCSNFHRLGVFSKSSHRSQAKELTSFGFATFIRRLPVVAYFTSVDQERRVLHQPWPNAVRRLKLYTPLLFNCASENSKLPLNSLHPVQRRHCLRCISTLNLWPPFAARNLPICVTKALIAGSLSDLTVIPTCSHPISLRKASVLFAANSTEDFACTTVDISILVVLSFATKMVSSSSFSSSPMKAKSMCNSGPTSSCVIRRCWACFPFPLTQWRHQLQNGMGVFACSSTSAPFGKERLLIISVFRAPNSHSASIDSSSQSCSSTYSHRVFITGQARLVEDASSMFTSMSTTYDPPFLFIGILSPVCSFLM